MTFEILNILLIEIIKKCDCANMNLYILFLIITELERHIITETGSIASYSVKGMYWVVHFNTATCTLNHIDSKTKEGKHNQF